MKLIDWVLIAVVAVIVIAAYRMAKGRKKNSSCCGGQCSECSCGCSNKKK